MNFRNKYVMTTVLLLVVSMLGALLVSAQTSKRKAPKAIELKAQKSTARGADDPNIKDDNQANDPNAKIPAPEAKGGPKSRAGSACEVRLDNRTNYTIKIYIDGKYRGTVEPYGDAIGYAAPGETKVYARADFTDGSVLTWGPTIYNCNSGQYIYYKMTN